LRTARTPSADRQCHRSEEELHRGSISSGQHPAIALGKPLKIFSNTQKFFGEFSQTGGSQSLTTVPETFAGWSDGRGLDDWPGAAQKHATTPAYYADARLSTEDFPKARVGMRARRGRYQNQRLRWIRHARTRRDQIAGPAPATRWTPMKPLMCLLAVFQRSRGARGTPRNEPEKPIQ
jgi:hypothetical protein